VGLQLLQWKWQHVPSACLGCCVWGCASGLALACALRCWLPAAALQLLFEDLQQQWLVHCCVDCRALQEKSAQLL
jgi:hypothetical protein